MAGLDVDWTKSEHAEHYLKELIAKKVIKSGSVLQISYCQNISIPKRNREGDVPHDPKKSIFKLALTDGKTTLHALVTNHPRITSSTPPGTKIEITQDVPIISNLIELKAQNTRVLGGNVPSLISHWEMQNEAERMKQWGFRTSSMVKDGPPLWKPFNFRTSSSVPSELRNVKAMELVKEHQKETAKNSDDPSKAKFDEQRQEVISELAKQTHAKRFGEGKKLLDKGVLDIMNEGFTEEEAEEALRRFKNPQKAIKHLKGETRPKEAITRDSGLERDGRRNKKGRRGNKDEEDEDGPTGNAGGEQPSAKISLFGFIEAKIKKDDGRSEMEAMLPAAGDRNGQARQDVRFQDGGNDRSYGQRSNYREDRPRGGGNRGRGSYQRSGQEDSIRGEYGQQNRGYDDGRSHRGSRGQRGGRRGGRGGGFSYRNDYGPPEPAPVFEGLKSNHFPTLGGTQEEEFRPSTAPSQRQYSVRPQENHDQRNVNDRNDRDVYRSNYRSDSYHRSSGQDNQHRGFGQEYPPRQGQYRDDRDSWFPPQNSRHSGPSRGSDFQQQFANLRLESNTTDNYSEQWRPSHTMVFSRSKK